MNHHQIIINILIFKFINQYLHQSNNISLKQRFNLKMFAKLVHNASLFAFYALLLKCSRTLLIAVFSLFISNKYYQKIKIMMMDMEYEDFLDQEMEMMGRRKGKQPVSSKPLANQTGKHFTDPFKESIVPIFDKYVENPKTKTPNDDFYGHPGMMMHPRAMQREMMMMMQMGRGPLRLNQVQRRLYLCRREFTYNSLYKDIQQVQSERLPAFIEICRVTNATIKQCLKHDLELVEINKEQIRQALQKRLKEIDTREQFNKQIQTIQVLVNNAKQFRKTDEDQKGRSTEQQQAINELTVSLLRLPSQRAFSGPLRRAYSNLREYFWQAHERQKFKQDKIKRFRYQQQSPYYKKIMIAVARSGLDLKEEEVSSDFRMDTYFTESIDKRTLNTLNPNNWLDNRVISNVLQYFKTIEGANDAQGPKKVLILNHSQSEILSGHPLQSMKHLSFSDYDKIILMINQTNKHWYVVAVFKQSEQKRSIWVYDSMQTTNHFRPYIRGIKKRIEDQLREKVPQLFWDEFTQSNTVTQQNTSDCGVCAIIAVVKTVDCLNLKGQKIFYNYNIINNLRYGLYLMLGYFAGCKRERRIIRKDYFNFLIRNIIYDQLQSYERINQKVKLKPKLNLQQ